MSDNPPEQSEWGIGLCKLLVMINDINNDDDDLRGGFSYLDPLGLHVF